MPDDVRLLLEEAAEALRRVDELLDKHDLGDPGLSSDLLGRITPLESIVGFKVAEECYDLLNMREQVFIDLLAAGWGQTHIAELFGITQPSVSSALRRIRFKLANSKMKLILESRRDSR